MTPDPLAGLAPCVHCGFCLQSCPTFLETGDEADSPRGRIQLMQHFARGDLTLRDRGLSTHLDRCLGCRACEPVCPSGVAYGSALEETRRRMAAERPLPMLGRMIMTLFAEPAIRAPAMALARLIRPAAAWGAGAGRIGFAMGMLAATRPWRDAGRRDGAAGGGASTGGTPRPGHRPAVLFLGCVQRELFGHVHAASRRTLAINGYRMIEAPGQQCCGALHAHAGLAEDAVRMARANVQALRATGDAKIVVNAAGCGAAIRQYPEWLRGDPLSGQAAAVAARVRDVTEALTDGGPRIGAPVPLRVAYDPPCHLLHAQGVSGPPERVLGAVPELAIVHHAEAEVCCGSAGIYGLLQPEMSRAVLDRKLAAVRAHDVDVVATGNPGCIMQLGAGLLAARCRISVVHPVEILDRSYARAGYYSGPATVP